MNTRFMPDLKNEAELKAHQLAGLKWTVAHAFNGSPAYRKKLAQAGVRPEDIQTADDIRKLSYNFV